jgi:hypothetical protein
MNNETSTPLQPITPNSSCASLTRQNVLEILQRINGLYVGRLSALLGDERMLRMTMHEWFDGLRNLSANDIQRGMKAVQNGEAGPHPPDLGTFRKLCEPPRRLAPYHRPLNAIEEARDQQTAAALPGRRHQLENRPSIFVERLHAEKMERERIQAIDDGLEERKRAMLASLRELGKATRGENDET